jgi:galactonate dehydratase
MKIAKIETLRLKEFPQLLWVEVTTNDGPVGLGETFFAPGGVETFIHDYAAPYLLGQDPRDVDRHERRVGPLGSGSRTLAVRVTSHLATAFRWWSRRMVARRSGGRSASTGR